MASLTFGCVVQTIDLRQNDNAPLVCPEHERVNPQTQLCEPCEHLQPHPALICPCDYQLFDAPFPKCAQDFVCLPCGPDITSCSAFNAAAGTVWNCDLFLQCCDQLAANPDWLACCPNDVQVVCAPTQTDGEYAFTCDPPACCQGDACPNGDSDCASWQTCNLQSGVCTPACQPSTEVCCNDCGCTCEPNNPPN